MLTNVTFRFDLFSTATLMAFFCPLTTSAEKTLVSLSWERHSIVYARLRAFVSGNAAVATISGPLSKGAAEETEVLNDNMLKNKKCKKYLKRQGGSRATELS